MFMGFDEKITNVKMKELGKKIFVTSNFYEILKWE